MILLARVTTSLLRMCQGTSLFSYIFAALLLINTIVTCHDAISGLESALNGPLDLQNFLHGSHIGNAPSISGNFLEISLRCRLVQFYGRLYFLDASIGSPLQALELMLDTGSTDTWVYGSIFCNKGSGYAYYQCYDSEKSSTSVVMPSPPFFEARYGRMYFQGNYTKDVLTISTQKAKKVEFGMVHCANEPGPGHGGIMGLGPDTAEFAPNKTFKYIYPDVLDSLYNESVIDSRAFGLQLSKGSLTDTNAQGLLVLGAYDKSGFSEPLEIFKIESPSDVHRLGAPLVSINMVISGVTSSIWVARRDENIDTTFVPAVFDSGDMRSKFPAKSFANLTARLNGYAEGMLKDWTPGERFNPAMKCRHASANISMEFTFKSDASITISVPFSELVLPSSVGQDCEFALLPESEKVGKSYWLNFGSSIVRSMYLVVDYDQDTIGIARARLDKTQAEIVPINHRPDHVT